MNIEQFPTSEAAKRMMGYITGNGFYDNSWVGKWLFQVMGTEIEDARRIVEELTYQVFPETATWGLKYHEEKYGLPVRENLSPEERRKLILEKRDTKAPITPWRIEQLLGNTTGFETHVIDINELVNDIQHPNVFEVSMKGEGILDVPAVIEKIKKLKQSHTSFSLFLYCDTGIAITPSVSSTKIVYDRCGTLPKTSMGLTINDAVMLLQEKTEAHRANYIKPNEHETGVIPNISTRAEIQNSIIDILENTYAAKNLYVQSGNGKAGEEPMQSTKLSLNELTIRIDEDAEGYKSVSILAGVDPNTSCGLDSSGEKMSMEPTAEEYIMHFKMCGEEL